MRWTQQHTFCAVGTTVVAALAAAPALAAEGPQGVRAGHNITVFHNIDMIGAFGHVVGQQTQVDVFRGAHRIASVGGAAFDSPDGGALEVNHGPLGAPAPGDCFEGATPDIRPGDRIVVSNPGGAPGVDEAIVDDIAITSRTLVTVDPATGLPAGPTPPPGARQEVWVEGTAHFMNADGTRGGAIPLANLDSAGFLDLPADNQLRVGPNLVDAPGGAGTYRARYWADFVLERNRNGHDNAYILNALATGDGHAMGFGHVVPLPPVAMLVDGLTEQAGPALGCEAAPKDPSSAGSTSVKTLNLDNTGTAAPDPVLTIGGWAAAGVTAGDVVLSNGASTVTKPVTVGTGAGPQGWSADFTKADIAGLAQGKVTAQLRVGGAAAGAPQSVTLDTVAPTLNVDLPEGTYTGPQRVSVDSGGDPATYQLDGGATRDYRGVPIQIGVGAHTLVLRSVDDAGNVSTRTLQYAIEAPGITSPVAPVELKSPGPVVAKAASRTASNLRVARKTRLRQARSRGILVTFTAPAGASVARLRLVKPGSGKSLAAKLVELERAGRQVVHLRVRGVKAGSYRLQVAVGSSASTLTRATSTLITLTR